MPHRLRPVSPEGHYRSYLAPRFHYPFGLREMVEAVGQKSRAGQILGIETTAGCTISNHCGLTPWVYLEDSPPQKESHRRLTNT